MNRAEMLYIMLMMVCFATIFMLYLTFVQSEKCNVVIKYIQEYNYTNPNICLMCDVLRSNGLLMQP